MRLLKMAASIGIVRVPGVAKLGARLPPASHEPVSVWRSRPLLSSSFNPKPFQSCKRGDSDGSGVFFWGHVRSSSRVEATEYGLGKGSSYPPPWFSVAPMMDWTDNHYRTLARLLSSCCWLYTEMIVADTIVHKSDDLDRILGYPEFQHPIVLQLGGSSPAKLATAARLASAYGYDEFNFNCGCPSDKVAGAGCFGARLMLDPVLVGEAMTAIAEASNTPVTVKCRIGVDDFDTYEDLCTFVSTVSTLSPTQHFIIHARKALLKGLSPAENRSIPPLRHEYVFALVRDFPHLQFTLNGGITNVHEVHHALQKGVHGVMFGRAAYNSPWSTLGNVDNAVYGKRRKSLTRREILHEYVKYADSVVGKYGPGKPSVRQLAKPLLNLFHSEPGAKVWKRAVDQCLRSSTSVGGLVNDTLRALPDGVLDSPPPNELPAVAPFSQLPLYPQKPAFVNSPMDVARSFAVEGSLSCESVAT